MNLLLATVGLVGVLGLGRVHVERTIVSCSGHRTNACDAVLQAIERLRADSVKVCHDMGEQAYNRFMDPLSRYNVIVFDTTGTVTFVRSRSTVGQPASQSPPDSGGASHVGHPGSLEAQLAANEAEARGMDPMAVYRACGQQPPTLALPELGVQALGHLKACIAHRNPYANRNAPIGSLTAQFDSVALALEGLDGSTVEGWLMWPGHRAVGFHPYGDADTQKIRHVMYEAGCTPGRATVKES